MQLSNERMRHTAEGEDVLDSDSPPRDGDAWYREGEEGGKGRPMQRDLSTAQEREFYGKVRSQETGNYHPKVYSSDKTKIIHKKDNEKSTPLTPSIK